MKKNRKTNVDSDIVKKMFSDMGAQLCGLASADRFKEALSGCHLLECLICYFILSIVNFICRKIFIFP